MDDSPPTLQEATKQSTVAWQGHLESLFHHAKDRFPDVVWELLGEDAVTEEVWAHKAIVYARAPPSFQNRYLATRAATDSPPRESALSLAIADDTDEASASPAPQLSAPTLLRLTTHISPALFANELEYLYTGKGFGEAFEFLFDSSDSRDHSGSTESEHAEDMRIDKLRKDLVFMWRSRLYSDVRIALTGNFGGSGHEATTAIFSSHRFVLVSRSSYFHTALIAWPSANSNGGDPPTLNLPSPPFTPASVHFTLGFLYTGTLIFSHRSYDLSTAFAILRSALYLSIPTLHDEVQARIAHEMLHGLFHAFLNFPDYEALTQGRWGSGGCRCRQCARRAPRVLAFAVADDVHNTLLERGARRALVGMFGEGWVTQEFTQLPPKLRESLLKGLSKRTTPQNSLPLLFAAEHALLKLANNIEPWADTVREAVIVARTKIDDVIAREAEAVFATNDWEEVVDGNGVRFEDGERVEWVMGSVMRGVKHSNAAMLYQTLVSSILLRPHPTEPNEPLLPATSHIRVQVEQTRVELLKWIGKNWLNVRMERGFDPMEGWSLKEISDHIEVPIEDLLSPPSYSSPAKRTPQHLRPASAHPHTSKADIASDASMRVSVLSRVVGSPRTGGTGASMHSQHGQSSQGHSGASSHHTARTSPRTPSLHSVRTVSSVKSAATVSTVNAPAGVRRPPPQSQPQLQTEGGMSPARRIISEVRMKEENDMRPDSKFVESESESGVGGGTPSIVEPPSEGENDSTIDHEEEDHEEEEDERRSDMGDDGKDRSTPSTGKKTLITRASLASVSSVASHRSTATSTTTTNTPDKDKGKERERSIRLRTSSAASSVTPSIRTRTTTGTVVRRGGTPQTVPRTTTISRPSSRTSTTSTLAGRTRLTVKPGAPGDSPPSIRTPRTPSNATSTATTNSPSRPTSRVSTRSVSGGARPGARPESSVSATTDSYRTASSGGMSVGSGTVGSRSRRTSGGSTLSTLSRNTATTGVSASTTTNTNTPGTPNTTGRRLNTTSARSVTSSPVNERRRRISGASMSSVASNVSTTPSRVGVGAGGVRKAVSAGPQVKEKMLSPAAAVAATAMARGVGGSGQVKATVSAGGTPSKVVGKKEVGRVKGKGKGKGKEMEEEKEVEVKDEEKMKEDEKKEQETEEEDGVGDQTVVLLAPPTVDVGMDEDTTVKIPLNADAEKENQAPVADVSSPPMDVAIPPTPVDLPVLDKSLGKPAPTLAPEDPPPAKTSSTITVRPPLRSDIANAKMETDHKKTSSSASSSSVATLRRKGSNDTIRTMKSSALSTTSGGPDKTRQALVPSQPPPQPQQHQQQTQVIPSPKHALAKQLSSIDNILAQDVPQGATLEIGIPCIITSKRKRFKAYARYIGEVFGESGSWVGVEVPMPLGDNAWGDDAHHQRPADDRPWHDGSWGGVRYFEIGGGVGGSEWEYAGVEDRAARRRRVDGSGMSTGATGGAGTWGSTVGGSFWSAGRSGSMGMKREGDQLSITSERMKRMRSVSPAQSDMSGTESRGLFVRPQQVLYVVDAVGTDL